MDWSKLYEKELFRADNCYLKCDSYCCNNFFGKYYNFLDKDSVVLPLIDEEYEIYKKRGGIKNIKEKKYELNIGEKKFIFFLLYCKEKGLCKPHTNRPFICRTYPFLPKVNEYGEIIGFNYASLFDIFFNKENHNCPLVKDKKIYNEWKQNLPEFSPKMIFALMLLDALIEELKKLDLNFSESMKQSVNKLELILLSGKVFKKIDVTKIYEKVKKVYGEFL
jgi:Fe-S-cluster containining protein